MVTECLIQMVHVYLDWGCGPWVLLGMWNTLYQMCHMPNRIVKAAPARVKQDFDPLDPRSGPFS